MYLDVGLLKHSVSFEKYFFIQKGRKLISRVMNTTDYINFIRNTSNFLSIEDNNLKTAVSESVKKRLANLSVLVAALNATNDLAIQKKSITHVHAELNILLTDVSTEFSRSEGRGLRLSPEQSIILNKLTEITVVLQGYFCIMNDADYIINGLYKQLSSLQLLRDVDTSTLEQLYSKTLESDNEINDLKTSRTTTTFADLFGIDHIVSQLINSLNVSKMLAKKQSQQNDNYQFFLLTGPPGTGKTSMAHAIASEHSGGEYYNLDLATLSSKYIGEAEKSISTLFARAESSTENMTIIIDEIENVLGSPSTQGFREHMQSVKVTLQTEISGNRKLKSNVIIVGMTNHYDRIDPVMYRRITMTVYVPPPAPENVLMYFKQLCLTSDSGDYIDFSQSYQKWLQTNIFNQQGGDALVFTNANVKQLHANAQVYALTNETEASILAQINGVTVAYIFANMDDIQSNSSEGVSLMGNNETREQIIYKMTNSPTPMIIVPTRENIMKSLQSISVFTARQIETFRPKPNNGNLIS